jgi:hypothetical protein
MTPPSPRTTKRRIRRYAKKIRRQRIDESYYALVFDVDGYLFLENGTPIDVDGMLARAKSRGMFPVIIEA